jgi:hypothetical protein
MNIGSAGISPSAREQADGCQQTARSSASVKRCTRTRTRTRAWLAVDASWRGLFPFCAKAGEPGEQSKACQYLFIIGIMAVVSCRAVLRCIVSSRDR